MQRISGVAGGLVALVLLGPFQVPLAAQEPRQEARIARLISSLGSDSFSDRSGADEELARLGAAAKGPLQQAAGSDDPEVRLRAKELLRRLRIDELWSPARVSFVGRDVPASAALAAISEQTGNRLMVGDQYGMFQDRPIHLEHADSQFWEVVDDFCRQSGNRVRPHYDTRQPGLVLVTGKLGNNPVAYAGPVRAQVSSARRVFTEELDYEQLSSQRTHTFQLDMQMIWEDRFKLVAYRSQPELIEAITDTGVQLAAMQPSGGSWNVAGAGTRQLSLNLRLHPPATTARELDMLRLRWGLVAVGDMAEINVDNLGSREAHFQDDVELVVDAFQQGPGARYELTLLVVRDLIVPEPQEVIFQESEVELLDAQGRLFRRQGQTGSLSDQGAKLKLTFSGDSTFSEATRLRFVYPRIRARKDLEIVFRHVALPVGRPE